MSYLLFRIQTRFVFYILQKCQLFHKCLIYYTFLECSFIMNLIIWFFLKIFYVCYDFGFRLVFQRSLKSSCLSSSRFYTLLNSQYYLTAVLDMFRAKKWCFWPWCAVLWGFNVIWIHKFFAVNVKLSIPTLSHNCTKGVSSETIQYIWENKEKLSGKTADLEGAPLFTLSFRFRRKAVTIAMVPITRMDAD